MDENVYRSELEKLRFTQDGKKDLTEALMAEQAVPAVRRCTWWKRGVAAAVAAVLLIGTAVAVASPLWEKYFGPLDEGQRTTVETLSGNLPAAATSNGATMTPLDAFGAEGVLYLMLEVEAPAETVLPVLNEEEAVYWLSGGVAPAVRMRLETPEGKEVEGISFSTDITCLEDQDPTDNRITLVVNLSSDQDLAGLTLRIPGLWKWNMDNTFTPIFTGDFAFTLEEDMGKDSVVTLDVDGVVAETTWGPITMESLQLSPLGMRWSYRIDEETARAAREAEQKAANEPPAMVVLGEDGSSIAVEVSITPDAPLTLVMQDGTEVQTSGGFCGEENGVQTCAGSFAAPVDLDQADYLLWGETQIPLR